MLKKILTNPWITLVVKIFPFWSWQRQTLRAIGDLFQDVHVHDPWCASFSRTLVHLLQKPTASLAQNDLWSSRNLKWVLHTTQLHQSVRASYPKSLLGGFWGLGELKLRMRRTKVNSSHPPHWTLSVYFRWVSQTILLLNFKAFILYFKVWFKWVQNLVFFWILETTLGLRMTVGETWLSTGFLYRVTILYNRFRNARSKRVTEFTSRHPRGRLVEKLNRRFGNFYSIKDDIGGTPVGSQSNSM